MSLLDRPTVRRVSEALQAAGLDGRIIELSETARSAEDAAAAAGCPLGAIVKSLVLTVGGRFVMALVAGDHRCVEENLPRALNMEGAVRRPGASEVKGATGFTIGGVPPLGLAHKMPLAIDRSLKRFETVYAAAGHPHCIFSATPAELIRVTGGIVSLNIAVPLDGVEAPVSFRRNRTFQDADESAV